MKNTGDDTLDQTLMSQEVSLLGRRYQDTSRQVQLERERQPSMGVMASKEVVDWLVFKTDRGERPAVSWDQIKEIDQENYEVDVINNNIVTSDTFEDINKNVLNLTTASEDLDTDYNQLCQGLHPDYVMESPINPKLFAQNNPKSNSEENTNLSDMNDNMEDDNTIAQASESDRMLPDGDFHNFSLFYCSQECFNIDSECRHQEVVLPDFECAFKL